MTSILIRLFNGTFRKERTGIAQWTMTSLVQNVQHYRVYAVHDRITTKNVTVPLLEGAKQ